MSRFELIATTSFGLEAVVARELKALGYDEQTVEDGRITFVGDESAICRANLWLRSAERVLLKVGSFEARDFGELFDYTTALPWSEWLPADAEFPVRGKSVRSQLHSVPDCQGIAKKAVVENLKRAYGSEWFPETGPSYGIEVAILKDRATLTLDTTGAGLHKRGYRIQAGIAPLKETRAAALVQLSYWNRDRPFLDPCCGSGTIPIEAALIGRNMAPGLNREFAAERWPQIPRALWDEARAEARDLIRPKIETPIVGSDHDAAVLEVARRAAEKAGVAEDVAFEHKELKAVSSHRKFGCVVCNPPYGERVGEEREVEELYRSMGRTFRRLESWSVYVLTSHKGFEDLYGRPADRRRKLYNGRIECTYYQYLGPKPPWQRGREREE